MPPPTLTFLDGAGRLEPVRVGIRFREAPEQGSGRPPARLETALLRPGRVRVGPWLVSVSLDVEGASATCRLVVRNPVEVPLRLDSVVIGLRWAGAPDGVLGFLQNGWQSWSFSGARPLDDGDPPFPSGPWLRGMHHAVAELPEDRAGWRESHLVGVAGAATGGPAALVGVLERGEGSGLVYARSAEGGAELEAEIMLETPVAPGAERELEPVRIALGQDPHHLLEDFADELGRRAGARTRAPFQTGWCSWYHFFHHVSEADLRRNLEALAERRDVLPVEVVQLDDGYQRAIGDWLETNPKFPSGLPALAAAIRDAGFTPGLWTAPFCVVPESRVFEGHRDWLLRQGTELHLGLLHAEWTSDARVYVLDPSREEVCAHLLRTFAALAGMGFPYLKLDFLYTVAMQADAHDPTLSRAARLRRGLEAIRAGAGDAFLLGCGCPLGPAVGIVDGMRIGPDVAPHWEPRGAVRVPGLEASVPSTRNAVRNVLARAWMHRRLWLNDPDCLMARTRDTGLRSEEARTLAACIAATGGMVIFSDDVPELDAEDLGLVGESIALSREVDEAGTRGTARALSLLAGEFAEGVVARTRAGGLLALVNAGDTAVRRRVDLAELSLPADRVREGLLGSACSGGEGDVREFELPPHASALLRAGAGRSLAVFCDFDGTFAVQDVGSTLARRHASERRAALWRELEAGKLSAWDYNLALLDGLALPEAELEAFLRSVELSPGARELVAWCERHGVPFRVLSDGFDYNLDRLQALHGVSFEYDANHLHYEDGRWRIQARHPNPDCGCGTGTCKRGRIERFRVGRPDAFVVHIGNGRVSDLCAVPVADLVFAKDSLAEELADRGVPFEPFESLSDVIPALERLLREQTR